MPYICAFGEAARIGFARAAEYQEHMRALREHAIDRLRAENPGLVVIGGGAPHILSVSLPGYKSEVLMNFLEAREIYSHVLEAMGLAPEVIDGAIRVGLSRYTTREEMDEFCSALRAARETLAHS